MNQNILSKVNNALKEYKHCYNAFLPKRALSPVTSIEKTAVAKHNAKEQLASLLIRDIYPLVSEEIQKLFKNFKENPAYDFDQLEEIGATLRNLQKNTKLN